MFEIRGVGGPPEDNTGNIIAQGFLIDEELKGHRIKYALVVIPEAVACRPSNMKENKSPGIDGIAPKIQKETVEQISMPLAHAFNMSLQEGIVPL